MAAVILLITIGVTLVYSALKGISITDALGGVVGDPLNPHGPDTSGVIMRDRTGVDTTGTAGGDPAGRFKSHGLKGPNADILNRLADEAEKNYNLRISQVCRDPNANYGSPTSFHKSCRAFDSVGKVSDRVAFARHAKAVLSGTPGAEVFCDQAGMVAPGYDHSDHVHVGA